ACLMWVQAVTVVDSSQPVDVLGSQEPVFHSERYMLDAKEGSTQTTRYGGAIIGNTAGIQPEHTVPKGDLSI
ncbi:MAG: hypothetical protein JW797_17910, partial [Bradymonadales bacterium]|nr:hypothetical protein [Bradymonadales bacterium]